MKVVALVDFASTIHGNVGRGDVFEMSEEHFRVHAKEGMVEAVKSTKAPAPVFDRGGQTNENNEGDLVDNSSPSAAPSDEPAAVKTPSPRRTPAKKPTAKAK